MEIVIVGNATLDVICQSVDDVPRYESISFQRACVTPGGCGSNVAIGLGALGVPTALVACIGYDQPASIAINYWQRVGLDLRFIQQFSDLTTGISVGLVDSNAQPRFIHTSGANQLLTVEMLNVKDYVSYGAKFLHVAGYFVLPGLMDERLRGPLELARSLGMFTSLDVVRSPRMNHPEQLWPCLPCLDLFLCNAHEALRLTGEEVPLEAARFLLQRGTRSVIVKLGQDGCWLECDCFSGIIPSESVPVADTTGAGDAFAAGLLAALAEGKDLHAATQAGNKAGARIVQRLGAVSGWFE